MKLEVFIVKSSKPSGYASVWEMMDDEKKSYCGDKKLYRLRDGEEFCLLDPFLEAKNGIIRVDGVNYDNLEDFNQVAIYGFPLRDPSIVGIIRRNKGEVKLREIG